jgi:UDP-N-acetylmuramate dehydrogenase
MNSNWQKELTDRFSSIDIDVSMKKHTYFRIGGKADAFAMPKCTNELVEMYIWCLSREIPITIIGNGTNLLVSDKGIRGVVIKINDNLSLIKNDQNRIIAQAGALLSTVAKKALELNLTGFEFASGIPGSIGGAVFMNAGAYDGEMKHVVKRITVMTKDGQVKQWDEKRIALDYRTSAVSNEGAVILEVEVSLKEGIYQEILDKMNLLNGWRRERQPLEMPSAGSTFKRPPDIAGSYLIDKAGLKGFTIGGAQVSEKHAGFIVNIGNATAQNVLDLMSYVQKKVYEKENVLLFPEVRILGEKMETDLIMDKTEV